MDLHEIRLEINEALEKRRKELQLTFVEEKHIYFMKDIDGKVKKNFPSVSKLIKAFYKPFDSDGLSYKMAKGDPVEQKRLQEEWKASGEYSTNMGSRVHYEMERLLIEQYGDYKEVRQPIFTIDDTQLLKSDNMIKAGADYLKLMHERGAVLLDTEPTLGDPELQYTGQADNVWLMMNKEQTDFGFVISDYKSNQPKNFEVQYYTGKLYPPFQNIHDNALGHYYLQLPLYGRLLLKMLAESKFSDKKLLGGVVVLLKDNATYTEYKVPKEVNSTILNLDIAKYISR